MISNIINFFHQKGKLAQLCYSRVAHLQLHYTVQTFQPCVISMVLILNKYLPSMILANTVIFRCLSTPYLPQVAEINPPQPMDAAGEGLLYDGFIGGILSWINPRFRMLKSV